MKLSGAKLFKFLRGLVAALALAFELQHSVLAQDNQHPH